MIRFVNKFIKLIIGMIIFTIFGVDCTSRGRVKIIDQLVLMWSSVLTRVFVPLVSVRVAYEVV